MLSRSRMLRGGCALAGLAMATGASLLARPAAGAAAVLEAEYWQAVATHGVEIVAEPRACFDAIAEQRRAIRSTTGDSVVAWRLDVAESGDAGAYDLWMRLALPAGTTRTLMVGQDVEGVFVEPDDRFVVESEGGDFFWVRATRQGSGTAEAPEEDPWPLMIATTPTLLEVRLVEQDILLDRLAVSNVTGYLPPDCGGGGDDGARADGAPGDDEGAYVTAAAAGCGPGQFFDRVSERCRRARERGCAAAADGAGLAAALAAFLLARGRARRDVRPPPRMR